MKGCATQDMLSQSDVQFAELTTTWWRGSVGQAQMAITFKTWWTAWFQRKNRKRRNPHKKKSPAGCHNPLLIRTHPLQRRFNGSGRNADSRDCH